MTKSTLSTKGFEEYLEKLAKAGADIDIVCDEALIAGANILQDGMVRRSPVRTGKLRRSIRIKGPFLDGNFHSIKVGVLDVNREKETYFFYQEVGSARTAAHPYIRPTFDEDMKKAKAEMLKIFKARGAL